MDAALNWLNAAFLDAHCHLQHDQGFGEYARSNPGRHFFCMTETPQEFSQFSSVSTWPENAMLGLGLHPWSVAKDAAELQAQVEAFRQLLPQTWLVGEVGLDFAPAHEETRPEQERAFRALCQMCAQAGGKVLSVHAARSAGVALDILEETGCLDTCTCIFHWFSGTQEELTRARAAKCYFSAGERMRATKRGRAYCQQIPAERLLFESDSFSL